jgi:YVTN family beta-propeller protein
MNEVRVRGRRSSVGPWMGLGVAVGALLPMTFVPGVLAAGAVAKAAPTTCRVGNGPEFPGYDPDNPDLYVPNAKSDTITVPSGKCTLVKSISLPTGGYPVMAVFDSANNHMRVTDFARDRVYDIAGTKVVKTFTGFVGPWGILYDPGFDSLVVANSHSNYVTVFGGSFLPFNVTTGTDPDFVGYDPLQGTLLVSNFGSNNVTILNAVTLSHVTDIDVGVAPGQIVYDPADQMDYVANSGSNNVTLLYGYGHVVGWITGFKVPDGMAWDQASLEVNIANYSGGKLFTLSGSHIVNRNRTASSSGSLGVVYDEANDDTYVANFNSDVLYIFS